MEDKGQSLARSWLAVIAYLIVASALTARNIVIALALPGFALNSFTHSSWAASMSPRSRNTSPRL